MAASARVNQMLLDVDVTNAKQAILGSQTACLVTVVVLSVTL